MKENKKKKAKKINKCVRVLKYYGPNLKENIKHTQHIYEKKKDIGTI